MTETVVSQRNTVSTTGFANPLNLAANAEESSHVKVYGDNTLLQIGVDYTLAGVGDTGNLDEIAGVNVTIDSDVLLADEYDTFTVEHDPPLDQGTDISAGGVLGRVFEAALDALDRRLQALGAYVDRSLRLPPDAQDVSIELPLPEDRRGLVWVLDQDTGEWSLENTASDPDTEPLTATLAAQAAAEAAQAAAEAAEAEALAQALLAADAADRAETAAAEAGDLSALLNFLWPVGAMLEHFGPTAPANFLACDGSAVSRAAYSALFGVIGTTYGAGHGSTTFNLPTWNDGRPTRATGGNAAAQGAVQAEDVGTHTHPVSVTSAGAHTHTHNGGQAKHGTNGNPGQPAKYSDGDSSDGTSPTMTTTSNGDHTHAATATANSGTENRPRNSSVLVCIKY